jgi:hypothetical protein
LVIALFLVGLLAGSVTMAGAAPPVAATLVAPTGVIPNGSVTFTWQAAAGATFYYLQVNDATASPKLTLWYPAAQACSGGSATCFVTITTGFGAGGAVWWIQTWNPDGFGPWSAGMRFAINYVPGAWGQSLLVAADRFQLVLGSVAVLDRETGLVWERTPSIIAEASWAAGVVNCSTQSPTTRYGWRMPTIEELATLLDPPGTPALPVGHPFSIGSDPANYGFWSASPNAFLLTEMLGVSFNGGFVFSKPKSTGVARRWCVRGGQTPQGPQ